MSSIDLHLTLIHIKIGNQETNVRLQRLQNLEVLVNNVPIKNLLGICRWFHFWLLLLYFSARPLFSCIFFLNQFKRQLQQCTLVGGQSYGEGISQIQNYLTLRPQGYFSEASHCLINDFLQNKTILIVLILNYLILSTCTVKNSILLTYNPFSDFCYLF